MKKSTNPLFSMVSTLPPLVGISYYTVNLLSALDKITTGEIFSFRKLYPALLYPGELYDHTQKTPSWKNINTYRLIDWYNPYSWIKPGIKMKGKILHLQWWSPATGHVYYFLTGYLKGKIPVVMTVHNILPHEANFLYRSIWNIILKRADGYIVHTEKNKEELLKFYPFVQGKKIEVIHHGIARSELIEKSQAREILNLPLDATVFLFFGTIREYKGLDVLLKAFANTKEKAFLVIAGKPWIDPKPYLSLVDELGIKNKLKLDLRLIPSEMIPFYFSAADAVVLPYKFFSSQSGVAALAISYCVPIITSVVGGLADFADPEAVFQSENVEALAEIMKKFIHNSSFRKNLKERACINQQKFSYDEAAKKTVKFYTQFL